MKVLYFHQHYSSPKGTVGTRSYSMAKALKKKGHEVVMVCGDYDGGITGLSAPYVNGVRRGTVDGIDIIQFELSYSNSDSFGRRVKVFLKFAFKSINIALSEKYDLLFATTTPLTAGIPGVFSRWLRNKPFVFEVRDLWPELPKAMGVIKNPLVLCSLSILEWVSYKSANQVIALSPGIGEGIAKRGVPRNRISLVPNGCDLDIFGIETVPWRPEQIPENDFLAIFSGTHGIANGLNSVIDVAAELKLRERTDIKILLVGSGGQKSKLIRRVDDEQLDNVAFHDSIRKDKLAALMSSADIGLQILANVPAFYYGTSPNKFFDYIAAGLPVLNNYPGWLADLIQDNQCGYTVVPESPSVFADALEHAASNKDALVQMGRNGRRLAEREFDRSLLAANWVETLESCWRDANMISSTENQ